MVLSEIWIYSLVSVFIVSIVSLIGVFSLGVKHEKLRTFLIYLISFSAGALLGDAFLHLLPESLENSFSATGVSLLILLGIVIFFILEKIIHWQHCHSEMIEKGHVHAFAYTNLVGDGLHNFLDGIIIAAAYLVSLPAGIATTLAVIFHEIPQEIGDFAVLLHGGFTKGKALLLNFLSALVAALGTVLTLVFSSKIIGLQAFLVPLAIGGFIYIAGSDLIPQLHKHSEKLSSSFLQLLAFIIGILVMAALLLVE